MGLDRSKDLNANRRGRRTEEEKKVRGIQKEKRAEGRGAQQQWNWMTRRINTH
jgi:hypothetical protein